MSRPPRQPATKSALFSRILDPLVGFSHTPEERRDGREERGKGERGRRGGGGEEEEEGDMRDVRRGRKEERNS